MKIFNELRYWLILGKIYNKKNTLEIVRERQRVKHIYLQAEASGDEKKMARTSEYINALSWVLND